MTTLLGAVAKKLIDLGYAPTSALHPGKYGFRFADDPAAVLTMPAYKALDDCDKRCVLTLTVTAVKDTKIRAQIAAVIAKHVGKGPVRIAADGAETFVLKYDGSYYGVPSSQSSAPAPGESDPALALDSLGYYSEGAVARESAFIRLDGSWRGDLLSVPRAKLPTADIGALFAEVDDIIRGNQPKVEEIPWEDTLTPAQKKQLAETRALNAAYAACNDTEILKIVERRLPKAGMGGVWEVLHGEALKKRTVELYREIEEEQAEAAALTAHRKKLGIGR